MSFKRGPRILFLFVVVVSFVCSRRYLFAFRIRIFIFRTAQQQQMLKRRSARKILYRDRLVLVETRFRREAVLEFERAKKKRKSRLV